MKEQENNSVLPKKLIVRSNYFSIRLEHRTILTAIFLCIAIFAVAVWSISVGDFPLSIKDVLASLMGNGSGAHDFIIFDLRLPRLLTGLLVGVALGMSGALFQSLAHNPLASPDIIGFNSGAALGAVLMIIVFNASGLLVTLGAVVGGFFTAIVVFSLSWREGLSPYRLVLVGIGVGFTAYAGINFLMTRTDIVTAASATHWLTGSLNTSVWSDVYITGIGLIIVIPIVLFLQKSLDHLEMGNDMAAVLGIRINFVRAIATFVGVFLAALAVAAAGPIPFVALVSGPIARRLINRSGPCLGNAALVGILVTLSADLAGRMIFAPMQMPVGVFTAIMGAPFLLWLLTMQIRKGAI